MGIKANDVGEWLRRSTGKTDHRKLVPNDDYLVLRPGPNFDLLFGSLSNPATTQVQSPTPERSPGGRGSPRS